MQGDAAPERMAQQHDRTVVGLLLGRCRQPTAVACQVWLQPPGPGPLAEAG
jgi:hypothetical protein